MNKHKTLLERLERIHRPLETDYMIDNPRLVCATCVAKQGRSAYYPCLTLRLARKHLTPKRRK